MTISKNYQKTKQKLAKLEQEISCIQWKVNRYEQVIKNAWWALTDIDTQGLHEKVYRILVIEMLSEVAYEVLEKEEKDGKR